MHSITFITGCSAAGKTTLYEGLRKDGNLADFDFHDIDEDGVPSVGRGPWRAFRIEQLLFDAVNQARAGKSSVVCGYAFPHEVIESRYYPDDIPVHFIDLIASKDTIRERLIARSRQNGQSTIFDESFNHDNIEQTISENIFNQTIIANAVNALKNGYVIDTETIDLLEVRDASGHIIKKADKE